MTRPSLVARVVGVVVAVAVIAIVATALVVANLAEDATIDEVQRLFEQQDEIALNLELAALDAGSWELSQEVAETLANEAGVRIVVRSANGQTLLDTESEISPTERTRLSQSSVQILSPFDTFFTLTDFDEVVPEGVPDGDVFDEGIFDEEQWDGVAGTESEFNSVLTDCLIGAGALESIEFDDFGVSVPIASDSEIEEICTNEAILALFGDTDFFDPFNLGGLPSELVDDALLFLGYSGSDELSGLDSGFGSGVVVVILLVTATSALVVGWWARRTLRPIGAMTLATTQMGYGNMSVRVDESVGGELGELAASFNKMAHNLAAEDDRRRRLTSDVAHELRTPLANVAGYLEAADDGLVEVGPALFEILRDETAQLSHIVNDLQDLSLADSGHLNLTKVEVRLGEVVAATTAAFGSRAAAAGVELRTTVTATDPISVIADAARLRQVATNLVENAIRHTDPGGEVVFHAELVGDMVEFAVSDTGVGMTQVQTARVFERFFRADESRTRATGGSGLGLSIVQQIVAAMGGTVVVSSELGVGSTFKISLPAGPT